MAAMARRLRAHGHTVSVFSYPSRSADIDRHADSLHRFICDNVSGEFSLIGHSLGGLVVLNLLNRYPDLFGQDLSVQRVVLMGSPVRGSSLVKRLAGVPGLKMLFGQVHEALRDGYQHIPGHCEVGMIRGTRSFGLGRVAGKHAEANDGSVLVSETRMAGLKDRIELPVAHSEMLISSAVADQAGHFIQHGRFDSGR